eukprot:4063465-Pleurochrysis_carterae.AAC.1
MRWLGRALEARLWILAAAVVDECSATTQSAPASAAEATSSTCPRGTSPARPLRGHSTAHRFHCVHAMPTGGRGWTKLLCLQIQYRPLPAIRFAQAYTKALLAMRRGNHLC